ncbi:MAG: hypothetical protein PHX83_07400 [Acidobacteriia bacterium]|nr:hypothetical protein [Terriglobia bacterium]
MKFVERTARREAETFATSSVGRQIGLDNSDVGLPGAYAPG